MDNDEYVKQYIAHVNTELQTKTLEVCSLKAQLKMANDMIATLQQPLEEESEVYTTAE